MQIIIFTKQGMIIKFKESDIPLQNRGGVGIKAIQLYEGDEVIKVMAKEGDDS